MKQLKYLIFPLIVLFVYGCSEDPIDRRVSSSDFFVTFETRSGNTNVDTLQIYENDPNVVTITVAATTGNPVDVTFDVIPPTGLTGEAAGYELFTMDDTPMTSKTITFENGTGSKSFKFAAKGDGNTLEGSRMFQIALTGNSAGYKMGYAMNGDASKKSGEVFPVKVIDDLAITVAELVGAWKVTEDVWGSSTWTTTTYTVTIAQVSGSSITIAGVTGGDPLDKVNATVTLGVGPNKYISLPGQDLPVTWNPTVITHFAALANGTFANNIGVGFTDGRVMKLVKSSTGGISTKMESGFAPYSWVALALDPDNRAYLGAFTYARNTTWEKQ